jgi:hypothetical protein
VELPQIHWQLHCVEMDQYPCLKADIKWIKMKVWTVLTFPVRMVRQCAILCGHPLLTSTSAFSRLHELASAPP